MYKIKRYAQAFYPPIFKSISAITYFVFGFLLIITACKKTNQEDIAISAEESSKIEQWYKANIKVSDENLFTNLKPIWTEVIVSEQPGQIIYEVPLLNPKKLMVLSEKATKGNLDIENEKHLIRLLIFENKATGKILYGAYMTVENITTTGFENSRYKKLNNFSGKIYYHHFNGKLSNGWVYENGKITQRLTAITKSQYDILNKQEKNGLQLLGTKCVSGFADKYQWQCVGVPGYENCGFNYIGTEYTTSCYWVPDEQTIDHIAPEENGGYIPPVYIDCAGVEGGTATWSFDCNTCIGGTTGITACLREIKIDTSITNNPKLKCLLEKLLGLNGNSANAQFMALLNAFNNKGFDVTFKIGTTKDSNSKGETSPDPNDPTRYNITLNSTKINSEMQMSWAKTLLHEAFHVNLMQKSYEMFGDYAVGLWAIGPKHMTLQELMDKIENVTQTNPTLAQQHHEFMAMNINIIKNGLKAFSLANNTNHANFNEDKFEALAYQGFELTSYYINKVCKDSNGNTIMVNYSGGSYTLAQVHNNKAGDLMFNSIIPCN